MGSGQQHATCVCLSASRHSYRRQTQLRRDTPLLLQARLHCCVVLPMSHAHTRATTTPCCGAPMSAVCCRVRLHPQVIERLTERRIVVEKAVSTLGEAPTGLRDVFELCRGFEKAFSNIVNVSCRAGVVVWVLSQGTWLIGSCSACVRSHHQQAAPWFLGCVDTFDWFSVTTSYLVTFQLHTNKHTRWLHCCTQAHTHTTRHHKHNHTNAPTHLPAGVTCSQPYQGGLLL